MKLALLLISFYFLSPAYGQGFHGYIAKFKSLKQLSKTLSNITPKQIINTSFGHFAIIPNNKILLELKDSPNIDYIEPNWIYHLEGQLSSHVDAGFPLQWGLENIGTNVNNGIAGNDINIRPAWKVTQGSRDVTVAIIDSGIALYHPDLRDNIWVNKVEKNGMPMIDDDGNGYIDDIYGYDFVYDDGTPPHDSNSHGTHCAGVIGASHNGIGIMGVMGTVNLMVLKFTDANGNAELKDALRAIDYAITKGAQIISASWGGEGESNSLKEAIAAAQKKGIIFVAAAGNKGANTDKTPHYPSSYTLDNIVSVGAFAPDGTKASFSNFGKTSVDIFAPGVDIFSTVKDNNYSLMSGTSMATPFVAGALGLLISTNPTINYRMAIDSLINSSDRTTPLKGYAVGGRLNTAKLLQFKNQ